MIPSMPFYIQSASKVQTASLHTIRPGLKSSWDRHFFLVIMKNLGLNQPPAREKESLFDEAKTAGTENWHENYRTVNMTLCS